MTEALVLGNNDDIALRDPITAIEYIETICKNRERKEKEMEETEKSIDKIATEAGKLIQRDGSLILDLKAAAKGKEWSRLQMALARIPVVRLLPQLSDVSNYFDFKDALTQGYAHLTDIKKDLDADLESCSSYEEDIREEIKKFIKVRRASNNQVVGYNKELAEIEEERQRLERELDGKVSGSDEYMNLDEKIIQLDFRETDLKRKKTMAKGNASSADNKLLQLRARAESFASSYDAATNLTQKIDTEMDGMEKHLKQDVQDIQIMDRTKNLAEAYKSVQAIQNAAELYKAERSRLLQEVVAEIRDGEFYIPEVMEAAECIAREGREIGRRIERKLLESPVGEISECYLMLGAPEDAPLEKVREAYGSIIAQLGPDDPRIDLARDAFERICEYSQKELPQETEEIDITPVAEKTTIQGER